MAIKGITLKESMNRSVQAIMPLDEEKEVFNQKLVSYLTHLKDKEDESEEYQKNLLKGFLESVLPYNFINTSSRIDLAIYNGNPPYIVARNQSFTDEMKPESKCTVSFG